MPTNKVKGLYEMIILPAIDLYDKKAVRLYKGDYGRMTVYSEHPEDVAAHFAECGAEEIHLVDLEGAKSGRPENADVVEKIIRDTGLSVEIGGGIRNEQSLKRYIDAGASRVILGTSALKDKSFLLECLDKYADRIAVGVDIKDNSVATGGWIEKSDVDPFDFCDELEKYGVKTVICTDISKDGAMSGTNLPLYVKLSERYKFNIIASGGISSEEDIAALGKTGIYGTIIGKAIYTGAIDLRKVLCTPS